MLFAVAAQQSNDSTLLRELMEAAKEYENFLVGGVFFIAFSTAASSSSSLSSEQYC